MERAGHYIGIKKGSAALFDAPKQKRMVRKQVIVRLAIIGAMIIGGIIEGLN